MDWMYDGRQVQKEDYLLGKKVEKNFGETTDNESIVPPQICAPDSKFSQVDMTKKILEDPLVNIKKREIECTQKILQNPVFLKKQQNVKFQKHTIEDHQLDMILVSRLMSYEKAGIDLAKILSFTKHKKKKEHKSNRKTSKSSSEEDKEIYYTEKLTNKQKKYNQKSNNFERKDKIHNEKNSFEYKDHKYNGNKNRNNRHRSVSYSDDINFNKRDKLANESIDHCRYKDNNKRYTGHKASSKEKYQPNEVEKNYESINKNNCSNYKQDQDRKKVSKDGKRHRSESLNREMEQKKSDFKGKNTTSEHRKSKNNNYNKNNFEKKQESQVFSDSRSLNRHITNANNRRSRSKSPKKGKQYQKDHKSKKDKIRNNSSSSSSSNELKTTNVMKQRSKRQYSPEIESDCEKHVQHEKDDYHNERNFGLFVPKGHSMKKSSRSSPVKIQKNIVDVQPKSPPKIKKKLTEEDMERMRKEMMDNAKTRDKERSSNVKRYRKEDKKEEDTQKPYSKDFFIKQLAHAASQVSVERSIKSNVNKLQKDNNFIE